MAGRVRITDVSPRDGLQNEPTPIPTKRKADLVRALFHANPNELEISSFVSPKWVPQLGDASDLFELIARDKPVGITVSALVPNEKGLDALLEINERTANLTLGGRLIDKVSLFTAASETFSQKNTNASIDETFERFRPVVRRALQAGLEVRGYISCAIECPFEGRMDPSKPAEVARRFIELNVHEIDLADTIGKATPETTRDLVEECLGDFPKGTMMTLHLHDTFGHAVDCVRAALAMGVRSFDAAVAGLGGCPYATTESGGRAPGNIDTLALVEAVEKAGYSTSVNHEALVRAEAVANSIKQEAAA